MKCDEKQILAMFQNINRHMLNIMQSFYEPLGLTLPQVHVLFTLYEEDRQKVSTLANKLGMTMSNISAICQRLEKAGYCSRTRSSEDQREVLISLSECSISAITDFRDRTAKDCFRCFNDASEEEMKVIMDGLTVLNSLLARQDEIEDKE